MDNEAQTPATEMDPKEIVQAAEQRVADAEATVPAAQEESKAATERHKAAKQTVANYQAALKALPADDEENRAQGQAAVEEAQGEVETAKAAEADAKAAVKAAKDEVKAAKAALRDAKKAAKEADKATKAAKADRVTQNGMTYPAEGTISHKLWTIFDNVSREKGAPAAFSEVLEPAKAENVVEGSIRAGYSHWRKFHGLTGRIMSEQEKADREAKAQEKAAKEQARAEAKAAKEAEAAAKAQAKADADAQAAATAAE